MFMICVMFMLRFDSQELHIDEIKKKKSKDGINDNNSQMTIDRKLQIAISRDYRAWLESDVNIKNI